MSGLGASPPFGAKGEAGNPRLSNPPTEGSSRQAGQVQVPTSPVARNADIALPTPPEIAEYRAVVQCAKECGGDHGQDLQSYPFHARGCPVEKELRPYWQAQFEDSIASKEEAIRALKIMDAFNRLALKYPVLEVLDAAKKWVAFIDSQAQKYAQEAP